MPFFRVSGYSRFRSFKRTTSCENFKNKAFIFETDLLHGQLISPRYQDRSSSRFLQIQGVFTSWRHPKSPTQTTSNKSISELNPRTLNLDHFNVKHAFS